VAQKEANLAVVPSETIKAAVQEAVQNVAAQAPPAPVESTTTEAFEKQPESVQGKQVTIVGLVNDPEFNGKSAVVEAENFEDKKVKLTIDGEAVSLKRENVQTAEEQNRQALERTEKDIVVAMEKKFEAEEKKAEASMVAEKNQLAEEMRKEEQAAVEKLTLDEQARLANLEAKMKADETTLEDKLKSDEEKRVADLTSAMKAKETELINELTSKLEAEADAKVREVEARVRMEEEEKRHKELLNEVEVNKQLEGLAAKHDQEMAAYKKALSDKLIAQEADIKAADEAKAQEVSFDASLTGKKERWLGLAQTNTEAEAEADTQKELSKKERKQQMLADQKAKAKPLPPIASMGIESNGPKEPVDHFKSNYAQRHAEAQANKPLESDKKAFKGGMKERRD